MESKLLLAGISIVIILGLAFYIGMLISKIKMQTELNNQRETKQKEKQQQRNEKICESIRLIARATTQKQCNVSEAAIRLNVLLETLTLEKSIEIEKEYPALSKLFHKVKEMPTHAQRKKVPIKELKKLDKQRLLFENEFEEDIIKETLQLATMEV